MKRGTFRASEVAMVLNLMVDRPGKKRDNGELRERRIAYSFEVEANTF